jgi:hypothetical protein
MVIQFQYPHRAGGFAVNPDAVVSVEPMEYAEKEVTYEGTKIYLDGGKEYECGEDLDTVCAKLNGEDLPEDE